MSGSFDHGDDLPRASASILRKTERLTKDRAKTLVAAGIARNAPDRAARQRLALAGGCSGRCVEKAISLDSLPSFDVLLNMLDEAPSLLDEALKARGFRLTSLDAAPNADLMLSAGLAQAAGAFCAALADGRRDHTETLAIATLLRPLVSQIESVIREADGLRGVA